MTDAPPDQAIVLKPCPFCGAELERSQAFSYRDNDCFVHPSLEDDAVCPAGDVRLFIKSPERIESWNRRASMTSLHLDPIREDSPSQVCNPTSVDPTSPHLGAAARDLFNALQMVIPPCCLGCEDLCKQRYVDADSAEACCVVRAAIAKAVGAISDQDEAVQSNGLTPNPLQKDQEHG